MSIDRNHGLCFHEAMNRFSKEQIEHVLHFLRHMTEKETNKFMRRFQKKQEPLLVYVSALMEREELNVNEQDLLVSCVLLLWKLTSDASPGQRMLTMDEIGSVDTAVREELEGLVDSEEALVDAAMKKLERLDGFDQPELVELVLKEIMEAPEEHGIRDDMKGILFNYVIALMEALLRAG